MAGFLGDPATATTRPLWEGGVEVTVEIPTYAPEKCELRLIVERDKDGDWVVTIPWPEELTHEEPYLLQGMEVLNGHLYLGAPDTNEDHP